MLNRVFVVDDFEFASSLKIEVCIVFKSSNLIILNDIGCTKDR